MFPPGHRLRRLNDGHVRTLTSHGWTESDLTALLDPWPNLSDTALYWLTYLCVDLGAVGIDHGYPRLSPAQSRSWIHSLYPPTSGETMAAGADARGWTATHGRGGGLTELVECYAEAAAGDHDFALLAWRAGLPAAEITAARTAGTLRRDDLSVLAALRA